jgi:8-oxo-dGTP diphosphatase
MSINSPINIQQVTVCVNVFVKKDGKWLVIRRSEKKRDLPGFVQGIGGKINDREDPYVAAQRELFEESGLEVSNMRLEAVITDILDPENPQYGNNRFWMIFYFSGDYMDGELKKTEEGELIWLTTEELVNEEKMFDSPKAIIQHMVDPQIGPVFAQFVYDKDMKMVNRHINICKR